RAPPEWRCESRWTWNLRLVDHRDRCERLLGVRRDDLNGMAVLEDARGGDPERRPEDTCEVRRVGETRTVGRFRERGSPGRVLHSREQPLPAQIALDRHTHLLAPEMTESAGGEMDMGSEGLYRLVFSEEELGSDERAGGGDPGFSDVIEPRHEEPADQVGHQRLFGLSIQHPIPDQH